MFTLWYVHSVRIHFLFARRWIRQDKNMVTRNFTLKSNYLRDHNRNPWLLSSSTSLIYFLNTCLDIYSITSHNVSTINKIKQEIINVNKAIVGFVTTGPLHWFFSKFFRQISSHATREQDNSSLEWEVTLLEIASLYVHGKISEKPQCNI